MSSIKQIITNAIVKVSEENPALNVESDLSAVDVRTAFIASLMQELFPEESAAVSVSLTEPAVVSPKKKVKKSKKEPEPEPAPAPVKSPKELKAEAKAAKAAEKEAAKAAKEAAKTAKADTKKSPKKAVKAPEPAPEPVVESPKKSPKKAKTAKVTKPSEDSNLQKIDPTWRKHLKKADKDATKEVEPMLLGFLNSLPKEEFNARKAEDHVTEFLAKRKTTTPSSPPRAPPTQDDGKVAAELETVEFEGKDYFVNSETNRVYEGEGEYDEEVGWTSYKPVGYVGMAKFAQMKV